MASAYDWSSTAASNATANSDITWAEGQNPNTVNDSARQMMKRVRDTLTDIAGATLVTGTANGLLLTAANAFTTLATGRVVSFRAASDNTGAATLNVNGIGAKSIRYISTSGDAALEAGMIQEDGVYVAIYGSHFNSSAGGWMLLNPTSLGLTSSSVITEAISGIISVPTNKSYTLVVKAPFGGTITETVTKSVSGTCTATFKVNSTALGGTANSVSSAEEAQAHAATNTFAADDDIVVTVSANAACLDMSFTIKFTRALA